MLFPWHRCVSLRLCACTGVGLPLPLASVSLGAGGEAPGPALSLGGPQASVSVFYTCTVGRGCVALVRPGCLHQVTYFCGVRGVSAPADAVATSQWLRRGALKYHGPVRVVKFLWSRYCHALICEFSVINVLMNFFPNMTQPAKSTSWPSLLNTVFSFHLRGLQ